MSATDELQVNRINTYAMILANLSYIELVPRTASKTGSGTVYVDGPARMPQPVRLIDQADTRTFKTADGSQRRGDFVMLMEWDATVGVYDYWIDLDGIRYEVVDILPDNGYERRAVVVRYGDTRVG